MEQAGHRRGMEVLKKFIEKAKKLGLSPNQIALIENQLACNNDVINEVYGR